MTDFTYAMDADGVVTLTWDVAQKSMNVMSTAAFQQLNEMVDRALGDPAAKGIILTSGKKDFAGGMDLNVIAQMRAGGSAAIFDGVMGMHKILRKIELAGSFNRATQALRQTGSAFKPFVYLAALERGLRLLVALAVVVNKVHRAPQHCVCQRLAGVGLTPPLELLEKQHQDWQP